MIVVHNGMERRPLKEAVFFPFDDHSIPFRDCLELHLIPGKSAYGMNPVVVDIGPPGSPDETIVAYRGTTLKVGDEFWMYYPAGDTYGFGRDFGENWPQLDRILLARSRGGYTWEKPDLGLVEYKDSKHNNIVDFPDRKHVSCFVLHEPDDPDPSRRFKAIYTTTEAGSGLSAAFSADGLRWHASPRNPVGRTFEPGGLIHLGDAYYACGQIATRPKFSKVPARQLITLVSGDFEHWDTSLALGYQRTNQDFGPHREDIRNDREEIHLGASLHDRGNVILGIYGMYHGTPYGEFHESTIDLGLLVTQDALHYREPTPGFRLVPAAGERKRSFGGWALSQGQGMFGIGDKTLYWYACSHQPCLVRQASWQRDRLGYFQPLVPPRSDWNFLTCPFDLDSPAELRLNVDMGQPFGPPGHETYCEMRFELLDRSLRVIDGFAAADCLPITQSAFDAPIRWRSHDALPHDRGRLRLRARFNGNQVQSIRFHALYLRDTGTQP